MRKQTIKLYSAKQTRELDRAAIALENIPGYELMYRAGFAAFKLIEELCPDSHSITIICGIGNNGGDGYVIAQLAKQNNYDVTVIQLGDLSTQNGEALIARREMETAGLSVIPYSGQLSFGSDVIVDAILGTGLVRDVAGEWLDAICAINASRSSVISIDTPSGINSDTGAIMGEAVKAQDTIMFIGRKMGLYTGDGIEYAGNLHFDDLSVPESIYHDQFPSALGLGNLTGNLLQKRKRNSHKGNYGHVLIVGGAEGMSGAVILAANAALRTGCGLVSVATDPYHSAMININSPEIMCHGVESGESLTFLLERADVIVAGPGLGQSNWARELFLALIETDKPLILDADALNWLAIKPDLKKNWILTPHPGEASRLLGIPATKIQLNRYEAVKNIQENYGGICLLKGAGTLIRDKEQTYVSSFGNSGMSTAGMGDVLSGIIGACVAQSHDNSDSLLEAVLFACVLHGIAGDQSSEKQGEKGMIASDLFPFIRAIINGK